MKTYRWRAGEAVGDVQHRPGYLGLSWDRELAAGSLLRPLQMFPWTEYNELCCLVPNARTLAVPFNSYSRIVRYEPEEDIAFLLEQIPTIDVFRDDGPPGPSFAAGSGYVFFQKKNSTKEAVQADILTLLTALRADLERLRAQFPE